MFTQLTQALTHLKRLTGAVIGFVSVVGLAYVVEQNYNTARRQEAAVLTEAQMSELVTALDRVSRSVMIKPQGARDAGPLMNDHFRAWGVFTDHRLDPLRSAWWAGPKPDAALRCMSVSKPERARFLSCIDSIPEGDLSILRELLAYDAWDRTDHGTIGALFASMGPEERRRVEADLSLYLVPLISLARLRVVQGVREGDILPALAEVRHLATLTLNGEGDSVDTLIARSLFGVERQGYEEAVALGLITADQWTPIPREETDALETVFHGLHALMKGRAPEGAFVRLSAVAPRPPGLCAYFRDAVVIQRARRALGGARWPGEPDLSAPNNFLEEVAASGRCDGTTGDRLWRSPEHDRDQLQHVPLALNPENVGGPDFPAARWEANVVAALSHVPYVRVAALGPGLMFYVPTDKPL